uniref:TRAP transporter large permease protein n=1 Tax=Candidatus Kentrum sp. FM TaxID=2126340 RepID=A0A450S529_9GAMM|nr:MAG: TRAP transporter, DctM subunit [Candidatus Kentron sp. FM]VFJ50043.1 MAG: TRAP transporter, DctM subunit [Candidatus Kentron sp. FM]VFK08704.1 MAG: TRAP transporter, DctM subunit [Candidatus Kentron sp. FM]
MIGITMFVTALALLLLGFPVAFTFGGVAVFFGLFAEGPGIFAMMPHRIWAIMNNTVLMAVPLFIFMGIVLQKSRLAERLLESMGFLFGKVRGGIAISTVLVGALLAASTGVVGASVVAMGVISLPVMLKYHYDKRVATGTICAAGTLGQIIPPSIVLVILGDVFQEPVGDLFKAAFWPGISLVAIYVLYLLAVTFFNKDLAPAIPPRSGAGVARDGEDEPDDRNHVQDALFAIIPPLTLIVLVLGSILSGIATPTESSSVGGIGAIALAIFYRQFSLRMLMDSALETVKITAMVFAILIGATAFSMVFTYTGGDYLVEDFMMGLPGEKWGFIILSMLAILVLGFFIDFVEISYVIVPILAPIAAALNIDPLWYAILVALNLQTSFLTPPFGFSLFYLKGVAPSGVTTTDIYRGVMPFILLQMTVLGVLVVFPEFFGFSS